MGWRAGRLCTALEVFVSVWFGVPAVRLVVAQRSSAASLTDDLQLARLARDSALLQWLPETEELLLSAQSRSGGHTVNTQCSAVSLPASRQDCISTRQFQCKNREICLIFFVIHQ